MKILYFSWIRERVGMAEERVELPDGLATVADFLGWLKTRNEAFEAILETPEIIRVAVNQEHRDHDEPLGKPDEIALFPPMTGG